MGVPIAAASLAMLWPLSKAHLALPARVNVFACGLWATIIVLDVSGVVRGEVGRIWIFLMPLGFLCVAREIGRGRLGAKGLVLLAVSQAVTCCFIARFWRGFY